MTTYAPVPAFAERRRHPLALILIVSGHAALFAAVMMVKMELPVRWDPTRTDIALIPYQPASEDGRTVASTTIVTLRFKLTD